MEGKDGGVVNTRLARLAARASRQPRHASASIVHRPPSAAAWPRVCSEHKMDGTPARLAMGPRGRTTATDRGLKPRRMAHIYAGNAWLRGERASRRVPRLIAHQRQGNGHEPGGGWEAGVAVMGDAGLETELAGEVCAWPCVSREGFEGGPPLHSHRLTESCRTRACASPRRTL